MTDLGPRVVLVRHAMPVIDPARPAGEWPLAGDVAESVLSLAEAMSDQEPDGIVSSPEPKALGTAELLAAHLDIAVSRDDALREQGLDTIPWIDGPDGFRQRVREHFERANEIVFGEESSAAAAARFAGALERARERYRTPVLVTHGRIMCGYLAATFGVDPVELWESLRMPDAHVIDLRSGRLDRVGP